MVRSRTDKVIGQPLFETALKMHLSGALRGVSECSPVQSAEAGKPLEIAADATPCNLVQPGAWLGGQDSNLDSQIQSLMAYR
jgi:hypothetical protein